MNYLTCTQYNIYKTVLKYIFWYFKQIRPNKFDIIVAKIYIKKIMYKDIIYEIKYIIFDYNTNIKQSSSSESSWSKLTLTSCRSPDTSDRSQEYTAVGISNWMTECRLADQMLFSCVTSPYLGFGTT